MFCTNCGSKLPDGSNFCSECGARLSVEAQKKVEAPIQSEKKTPSMSFDWSNVKDEPRRKPTANVHSPWGTTELSKDDFYDTESASNEDHSRITSFLDLLKKERDEKAQAATEEARHFTEKEKTAYDYSAFENASSYYTPQMYDVEDNPNSYREEPRYGKHQAMTDMDDEDSFFNDLDSRDDDLFDALERTDDLDTPDYAEAIGILNSVATPNTANAARSGSRAADMGRIENERQDALFSEPEMSTPTANQMESGRRAKDATIEFRYDGPEADPGNVIKIRPSEMQEYGGTRNVGESQHIEPKMDDYSNESPVVELIASAQDEIKTSDESDMDKLKKKLNGLLEDNSPNEVNSAVEANGEIRQTEQIDTNRTVETVVAQPAIERNESAAVENGSMAQNTMSATNTAEGLIVELENEGEDNDADIDNDVLSVEDIEKELFAGVTDEDIETEETKKIDKFYTLYKKNEEFQKLLDEEYDKINAESDVPHVDDILVNNTEQEKAKQGKDTSTKELKDKEKKEIKAKEKETKAKEKKEKKVKERKGGSALTVIAVILAVLLVIILAMIIVMYCAPYSVLGMKINSIFQTVASFFSSVDVFKTQLLL